MHIPGTVSIFASIFFSNIFEISENMSCIRCMHDAPDDKIVHPPHVRHLYIGVYIYVEMSKFTLYLSGILTVTPLTIAMLYYTL